MIYNWNSRTELLLGKERLERFSEAHVLVVGLGGVGGGAVNIEDELSMFTSNKLIRSMVLDLGINVEYCEPWTFGYRLYGNETLFKMTADSLTNATLDQNVDFVVKLSGGRCHVTAEAMTMDKKTFDLSELPATIELPVGKFRLALAPGHEDLKEAKMEITYRPASFVAEDLADEFLIEESSKTANVIELGCTDYERARGKDMLNTLIRYYNEEALSYQKSEATKTLAFLDGRIDRFFAVEATAIETVVLDQHSGQGDQNDRQLVADLGRIFGSLFQESFLRRDLDGSTMTSCTTGSSSSLFIFLSHNIPFLPKRE